MAERRMFSKTIIDSDAFLDMPLSTQALYFHLSMRADDDGFTNNPKKIMRMIGASQNELELLLGKRFLILFETGVVVIKHWKIHNYIRSDRYKPTVHIEEYNQLTLKENKAYTEAIPMPATKGMTSGIPIDNQEGTQMDTQVRLGKDSIGKDNINNMCESDNDDIQSYPQDNEEPVDKHNYKSVYDHYMTLGLISHRTYTDEMTKAIKKAMTALKCDEKHLMKLLDRHKKKVDISNGTDYPIKVRTLCEFFGQKKYQSTELICVEYDDPWIEPKREDFMKKGQSNSNQPKTTFHDFNQRQNQKAPDMMAKFDQKQQEKKTQFKAGF